MFDDPSNLQRRAPRQSRPHRRGPDQSERTGSIRADPRRLEVWIDSTTASPRNQPVRGRSKVLEKENFPAKNIAHGDWRDGVEPPCAGGYPTEIAGCMQCAREAHAQGICAADKGGAAMGSTGAGWGTMWARPHFPPVSPGGRARTCRLKSGGTAKVTASTGEATILLRKAMYFRRTRSP